MATNPIVKAALDKAAKLRQAKSGSVSKPKQAEPKEDTMAKAKKSAKKSGGKRGHKMDELRPKIKAMRKQGMTIAAIAKKLNLSPSYVWVIEKEYVYDPDSK